LVVWIFKDIWIICITRSEASIFIMAGYSYTSHQFIQRAQGIAKTLPMSNVNNYFASTINPHVDVARFDTSRHVASASNYSDGVDYANIIRNLICKSHC
jgi:hypothetical protein